MHRRVTAHHPLADLTGWQLPTDHSPQMAPTALTAPTAACLMRLRMIWHSYITTVLSDPAVTDALAAAAAVRIIRDDRGGGMQQGPATAFSTDTTIGMDYNLNLIGTKPTQVSDMGGYIGASSMRRDGMCVTLHTGRVLLY